LTVACVPDDGTARKPFATHAPPRIETEHIPALAGAAMIKAEGDRVAQLSALLRT